MHEMGFPEHRVRAALSAAFNNPERATESLVNGLPQGLNMPPATLQQGGAGGGGGWGGGGGAVDSSTPAGRAVEPHPMAATAEAMLRVADANGLLDESESDSDDKEGDGGAAGSHKPKIPPRP